MNAPTGKAKEEMMRSQAGLLSGGRQGEASVGHKCHSSKVEATLTAELIPTIRQSTIVWKVDDQNRTQCMCGKYRHRIRALFDKNISNEEKKTSLPKNIKSDYCGILRDKASFGGGP